MIDREEATRLKRGSEQNLDIRGQILHLAAPGSSVRVHAAEV